MKRTHTTPLLATLALGALLACEPGAAPREVTPDPAELMASPPPSGVSLEGFVPVVFGRDTAAPHVFLIPEEGVTFEGDEIRAVGDVHLATPGGYLHMRSALLSFDPVTETVGGTASVPLPGFGLFEGLAAEATVLATVGYGPGADLGELGVPLADDRDYLFYRVITGGALVAGELSLETGGPGALVVMDPLDPSIFLAGELLGMDKLGPLEDATLGLSARGLIPFEPLVTPRDPADAFPPFDGELLVMGTVALPALPSPSWAIRW